MARRKIRDADEARILLDRYEVCGASLVDFARMEGIDGRSLNAWRINLERARRRDIDSVPEFIELVSTGAVGTSPFLVRCGPFAVEVPPQFDAATLARLLEVVATC